MQLRQLRAAGSPSQRTTRRASRTPLRVNALLKQASGLAVSWRQTVDNVLIDVPVDPQVRGRDLNFELHPRRLALSLHGEPLLAGSLEDCGAINLDDSFWTLEEGPGPEGTTRKWVAISLGKRTSGYNSWDTLLESERMDTRVTDRCFLELAVGEQVIGKVAVGLFGNVVPRTAANFKALCTGERGVGELGKPLHFKGSSFHRIIPGFMAQGGDITANNGTGGDSIYGPKWEDENFKVKHDEAGLLAMANAGPGTNSSQFYVLFKPAPHLDGKHVVFGKVLGGMNLVRRLEDLGSSSGRPQQPVTITDCGLLESDKEVEQVIDANKLLQLEQAMRRNEAPLEEEPEWLSDIGGEEEPEWLANMGGEEEKLLEDFGEEGGWEGEEEGVWEGEGEAQERVAGAEGKGEERVAGAEGKGEERVAGVEGKGEERVAGVEGKGEERVAGVEGKGEERVAGAEREGGVA
ncbi:cyclophilin-like domain-containing protein [Haematococcus lacustris]